MTARIFPSGRIPSAFTGGQPVGPGFCEKNFPPGEEFGLHSYDYSEYIFEVRERLAHVKAYLLTDKQREFYHHVMTEYENRTLWYQSICYTILEQRLDALRDEQEDKLADDLVYLFRECEKYSDISQKIGDSEKNEAYSFDMVTNRGNKRKNSDIRSARKGQVKGR